MTESSFLNEVALIAESAAGAAASAAVSAPLPIVGAVAPPDTESLAAIMRLCTQRRWPVWPVGASTWQHAVPAAVTDPATMTRPPLVVTTAALNAVLEHEPADLVVGVLAGMSLTALHEHLAGAGQRLPLDPPAVSGATIGATIALGCAGPLRARYGLPRDMALGLEVVTGDGRVLRFGGRVVKNVAGYDGVRMFTGSGGALGIITAAFLRVRSIPRADRTWSIAAPAAGLAAEVALAFRAALEPDALELISPSLATDVGLAAAWMILIRVAGSEDAVSAAASRVRDVAARAGLAAVDATEPGIWDRLGAAEASAQPHFVLPAGVSNMAAALAAIDRTRSWQTAVHAADGIIRIWSRIDAGVESGGATDLDVRAGADADDFAEIVKSLDQLGTGLSVVRPVSTGPAAAIASRLAASFDPAGVLLPGHALRESAR